MIQEETNKLQQTEDNFDQKQQYSEETDPELAKQNALLLRRDSVQSKFDIMKRFNKLLLDLFQGYYYDGTSTAREVIYSNSTQASSIKKSMFY